MGRRIMNAADGLFVILVLVRFSKLFVLLVSLHSYGHGGLHEHYLDEIGLLEFILNMLNEGSLLC